MVFVFFFQPASETLSKSRAYFLLLLAPTIIGFGSLKKLCSEPGGHVSVRS